MSKRSKKKFSKSDRRKKKERRLRNQEKAFEDMNQGMSFEIKIDSPSV